MAKPTRDEFEATVKAQYPGATFIQADRGLYVVVGSADVAMSIQFMAKDAGLKPGSIDERGPEDYLVRVFGSLAAFGARKRPSTEVVARLRMGHGVKMPGKPRPVLVLRISELTTLVGEWMAKGPQLWPVTTTARASQ